MIPPYTLAVTRHLICGNKLKCLRILNVILGTLWNRVVRSSFNAGKTQNKWFLLIGQLSLVSFHWHIVGMLLVLVSFIDIILVDVLLIVVLVLMIVGALLDILRGCMTLLLLFLVIANRSKLIALFLRWLNFGILYLVSASF